MKDQHYRNLAITFALIIVWILVLIFSSYDNENENFNTWSLYFNFGGSMIVSIILGFIMLILRMIFYKNGKLKNNLFYTFFGFLNLIISMIWLTSLLLKVLTIDYKLTEYGIACCFVSIAILTDLYWTKKGKKEYE